VGVRMYGISKFWFNVCVDFVIFESVYVSVCICVGFVKCV